MPSINPRTATASNSIWRDLPEDIFRQHLVSLEEKTNAIPTDPELFDITNWHPSCDDTSIPAHVLPVKVEQEFTDAFARLVAVEEGAQSVAAVCLEERLNTPRLTLQFASLDISLSSVIRTTLQNISDILAKAALSTDEKAQAGLLDDIFQQVVQLHFLRLLGRLRSTKWEKPKYLSRSHKKPLWQDFKNVLHRTQFLYTRKERPLREQVESTITDLSSVYQLFEKVAPSDNLSSLVRLVDASFSFCNTEGVKDFESRLESSVGITPTPQVASAIKCLRQIQKIAAYRRLSVSLVETATKYPQLFHDGLRIEYLDPYKSIPTTIGYESWAESCHVHAEIQLVVHYDLVFHSSTKAEDFLRPRCIGISKWLCFLCCRFLQAHGRFFPSKTHGRLYDQWTIPDLEEFGATQIDKYREILRHMDDGILNQANEEPEIRRIEPMTSL